MNPIKLLLLAGAGFFAYEWWTKQSAPATAPATTTPPAPGGVTTNTTTTAPGGITTANPADIAPLANASARDQVIISALQGNAAAKMALATAGTNAAPLTMSADNWNWYESHATGVQQTTDLFPAGNRGALMTIQDYLAARSAHGLTGYGWGLSAAPRRYR